MLTPYHLNLLSVDRVQKRMVRSKLIKKHNILGSSIGGMSSIGYKISFYTGINYQTYARPIKNA